MRILENKYPDKKVYTYLRLVRIKGNPCRVANIKVYHNEKKNLTQIDVWMGMPFWMGMTIIIPIVFVGFAIYSMCGNWAKDVTETLKQNL